MPFRRRQGTGHIPPEVRASVNGVALAAGGANVIMQLSLKPVGYGVALSTVESGRVDRHPIERLRTTTAFLVITVFGTEDERRKLRTEINRAHTAVRSRPGDAVQYNAFDPELQLWVAACLLQGILDICTRLRDGEPLDPERAEAVYQFGKRLGSDLQVPDEMWPPDFEAFQAYWAINTDKIEMDDVTRGYLTTVADMSFLVAPLGRAGAPLKPILRAVGRFMTLGFLPERFREELGIPWSAEQQQRHDRVFGLLIKVTKRTPRPIRQFPANLYLWDTRRRLRNGTAVV